MNIDFNMIQEIHGDDIILLIKENLNYIYSNIKYLNVLGFTDTENIFERYPTIFINSNVRFRGKINSLIKIVGLNYVEIIENDLSLLDVLL